MTTNKTTTTMNDDNLTATGAIAIYSTGEGGKGGGGGGVEAENTLRSAAIVRIVEVISEGPIEGLAGGGQGIYLNNTPFFGPGSTAFIDGSGNLTAGSTIIKLYGVVDAITGLGIINPVFEGGVITIAGATYLVTDSASGNLVTISPGLLSSVVAGQTVVISTRSFINSTYDYRVGLPTQDYMPGFSAVESEISVASAVTIVANDITRTVSSAAIDAVMVTIQLPSGLNVLDSKGNLNGSAVEFKISTRKSGGTFAQYGDYTITGKTTSAYEAQYRIPRPATAGPTDFWDIRVTRVTADGDARTHNAINWARVTEIQEVKVTYPDTAVVGLTVDAQSVGNAIPTRGYLVKGLLYSIPSNLNPVTRAYTGAWDGTFTTTTVAFNNPVWALWDMMTNTRYGAAIAATDIDKWSFYDASVYCDQNVNYTDRLGATVSLPRFMFDVRIADRPEMFNLLKAICGSMNANLVFWNGKWTLIQDRPTSVSKIVTKANTIAENGFTYKSTGLFERHTAFNVSFNDRSDRYLERIVTVEATPDWGYTPSLIDRYGYNTIDIAAYGCTTEGQAIRTAKWAMDTEMNQTEIVNFSMSINGFDLMPGDVISVYDEDTAANSGAGRIVSASGTTVVLDRPVVITTGSTITALLADGRTLQTRPITGTGTLSTLTLSSAFSTAVFENADFLITSAIAPRPFKVINITCPEKDVIAVEAVFYDENKFSRVEGGVILPPKLFTNALATIVNPPTNLTFSVESVMLPSQVAQRSLRATWAPPANTTVAGYTVVWYRSNENIKTTLVDTNFVVIPADKDGIYTVSVFTRDFNGKLSGSPTSGTYTLTSGVSSLLSPVTGLSVVGGGTTFNTDNLTVVWTNPTVNGTFTSSTNDFLVTVKNGSTILRTTSVPPVAPGATQTYIYSYSNNITDGGPTRVLTVEVVIRDTTANLTTVTSNTFTNPTPGFVSGLTATPSIDTIFVKWVASTEPDVRGYIVWRGTSSGFTPSSANVVSEGNQAGLADSGLTSSTAYFYKVAAYDGYGKSYAGTGLNVSVATSATTLSATLQNEYKLTGSTWTPNSPSTNQVAWTAGTVIKTGGAGSGGSWSIAAGNATWTSGILYIYYHEADSTLSTTSTLATAIAADKIILATYRGGTALEIGNGNAYIDGSYVIAGTVGAAQLVTGSAVITQTAQIANLVVTDAKFTGLLSAAKIDGTGLVIKDNLGNVILASGSGLPIGYIPGGALNSNITVNGSGQLLGIGTGSGTGVANTAITVGGGQINGIGSGAGTVIDNSYIGVQATTGLITGIGTGNNTPVSNNFITVTGGNITGIGTGNNTTVANSYIAVSGGVITGIGTGSGTAVANNSITISGGVISGIGTGTGTAVANSNVSISAGGVLSGAGGGTVTIGGLDNTVVRSANPITTSNVSTYIGALAVDTIYIAAQAVTIPVGAFTGGPTALGSTAPVSTSCVSVTFTSTGAPITISGALTAFIYTAGASNQTVWALELWRGSTKILNSVQIQSFTGSGNSYCNLALPPYTETPGAGSVTYYLKLSAGYVSGAVSSYNWQNAGIFAIEVKK